ncbi:MAG: sulfur oxidation c-type cytochrome SoxA [Gammaproteobacteria bacterium]|nr:sulfur oxidation c-type cytochrome SoxA [Gammaproteobacteria bacterium]
MKTLIKAAALLSAVTAFTAIAPSALASTPEQDRKAIQNHMTKKFAGVPLQEYANGVYAIDRIGRDNWEAIEEFPPYEIFIDAGEQMWNKKFKNGKSYKSCFGTPIIAHKYPKWDAKKQMVMTLPLAINNCRKANGEKPLKYKKGSINNILSYISYQSRGKVTNVVIPKGQPGAMKAYEAGKKFYFTRRGQLNLSCANCHVQQAGMQIRSEILSPGLGHTTHQPVYRSKWATVGTLHRRFTGCNKQVRAKPFKAQGEEYRNLEYFLTYMSNGIELNGPGARK